MPVHVVSDVDADALAGHLKDLEKISGDIVAVERVGNAFIVITKRKPGRPPKRETR